MKLTKRQLEKCEYDLKKGKGWRNKQQHCLNQIKSWGVVERDLTESELEWFFETFVPLERKRHNREEFKAYQSGERIGPKTPTDIAGGYDQVEDPQIGKKYHLSWAFQGAVFVLQQIDLDKVHCYLDNPRHKRKKPLKAKLEDLRHLKNRK